MEQREKIEKLEGNKFNFGPFSNRYFSRRCHHHHIEKLGYIKRDEEKEDFNFKIIHYATF